MSVIICLGEDLKEDGSLPTSLMNRIDVVCKMLTRATATHEKRKQKNCRSSFATSDISLPICIIFSGYVTKGCTKSQSQAMWEYFQEKLNIEPQATGKFELQKGNKSISYISVNDLTTVILEERAQNTVETLAYCLDILEELYGKASKKPVIYIVTCDYHCPRTALLGNHLLGHIGHCFDVPVPSFLPKKPNVTDINDISGNTHSSHYSFCNSDYSLDSINSTCDSEGGESEDIIARLSHNIYVERRRLSKINRFLDHYHFPHLSEQSILAAMQQLDEFERSFLQFL